MQLTISCALHLLIPSLGKAVPTYKLTGPTHTRPQQEPAAPYKYLTMAPRHVSQPTHLLITLLFPLKTQRIQATHPASCSALLAMASVPGEISPGRKEGRGLFQTKSSPLRSVPGLVRSWGNGFCEHAKHRHYGRNSLC